MKKYSAFHRIIAYVLSFVLVLGVVPAISAPATAEENISAQEGETVKKVADPGTMDRWLSFFGPDAKTTEYAGGVWTDKSVFTDASNFGGISMTDEDGFLVALSAIAANQEIVGSNTTPTDTVLVLDLSQSMDNSRSIPSMVSAANAAIAELLKDKEARVGVVLYSGSSNQGNSGANTATVVLPLDHYTTGTDGEYLTYSGTTDTTVSVDSDVRNSAGSRVSGSKNTIGATYIQNGLFRAWLEFEDAATTTAAGAQRKPIIVLMSDGAPTVATESFYGATATSIGTSNVGNGMSNQADDTVNRLTFLTQLTASWVKAKVADHYRTAPLFYTLGLGTGTDTSATSVLNPINSNTTVNGWWTNYLAGDTDSSGNVTIIPRTSYFRDNSWKLSYQSNITAKNYVDKYFYASQASDLAAQFNKIVQEIQLQTASFPTLVQAGRQDLGGYITFEDELGVFMEVKDMKGIWLDGTLFSGANIAHAMTGAELGLTGTPTEAGYEYINTVMERIGAPDESAALQLIRNAINAGQISYTSDTDFSNYIGWYADANGNYLGFWQESYGTDGAPAGAKYINRSYAYLGDHNASDMMHVVVMVSTNIENGNQSVTFKIPASLIPMVTYKVDIDTNSLATANDITVEYVAAKPMRLLFEVGLRDDINELNIDQKIEELLAEGQGGHVHKNDDGSYTFYTNRWGGGDGSHEIDYSSPLSHLVTSSHFHPAQENTRYYYTEPELICTDTNGTALTTAPVAGTSYYRAYTYVTYDASGKGTRTTEYVPIAADIIADSDNWMEDNGKYYVKAGSIYQETARFRVEKTNNATNTLTYVDYPTVLSTGDTAEDYNVYAFLGNNGMLNVTPAQGIKLTKTVETVLEGAPTEFTFRVSLNAAVSDVQITDEQGDKFTGSFTVSTGSEATEITVTLRDGQSVYITGIPAGVQYTVQEVTGNDYYTPKSTNSTGTVQQQIITAVDFVNVPKAYGSLNIRKDVQHTLETTPEALTKKVFTFQVQLSGPDIKEGDTFTGADGAVYTVDAQGYLTASGKNITLTDETFVLIEKIPEGTTYTVTEIQIPDGYTFNENSSTRVTGTITGDTTMFAHMVNNYTPTPLTPAITLKGSKTVVNESDPGAWPANAEFEIKLEQVFADGNVTSLATAKITENDPTYTFELGNYVTITQQGMYYFRVSETVGSVDGMLYDVTQGLYRLVVTDEDMDGTLEYTMNAVENSATVNGNEGVKDFVNTYSADSTTVSIPITKVVTGHEHTPGGFLFTLTGETGSYSATSDANGTATIVIPYSVAGVYTYTLAETKPLVPIAGMIYSTETYTVTVTVTDQGGQLVGDVQYKDAAGNTVDSTAFTNEYRLDPVDNVIAGKKTLHNGNTGAQMPVTEGQFSFSLYSTDTSYDFDPDKLLYTVTNASDGSFSFPAITYDLPGTYRYVVAENAGTAPGYSYDSTLRYVTVVVTVNAATGDLEKAVHYWEQNVGYVESMTLRNTYTVTGTATEQFAGSKTLTGRDIRGGEFSFTLSENGQVLQTVRNKADGTFIFDPITYTAADIGTHTYTIAEVNDGKGGVTYDATTYTVTVVVADDGKGGLTVTRTEDPTVTFNNTYKPAPTQLTLPGTKVLTGRTLKENEFAFNIYSTDAAFTATYGLVQSVRNAADGKFAFTLDYDTAGTYYYLVNEDMTNAETGMHYDARRFRVTVHVTDDGNGNLSAMATIYQAGTFATAIAFTNEYRPEPIDVPIDGNKVLTGRALTEGEFTFKLTAQDGTEVTTTNASDGSFSFLLEGLSAGTYTYTVSEVKGSLAGVTYDETVYTVTVLVEDVGGTLEATVTHDRNGALTFTNTYTPEATAAISIDGTKQLTGRNLNDGEFTFRIYSAIENADGSYALSQDYATVTNDANGNFTVNLGSFDKTGTYWFVVNEQIPAQTNGVTYDTTQYGIKVTVTDNPQTGKLQASYMIRNLTSGSDGASLSFVNAYNVSGTTQLGLTATKTLTGRAMTYGEFAFQIKDQSGNVVATGTNQLNGVVNFSAITYTADDIGAHTYTVTEVRGEKDGVTYDETVYTIYVTVADNGEGGVTASYTVDGNKELIFENSYKAKPAEITIEGTKRVVSETAQGRSLMQEGDYTFVLTDSNGNTVETTNAADGSFSFKLDNLTAGVYTYTVSERKGNAGGMTYDETVYTVMVTVVDNGDGTSTATYTVDGAEAIAFTNIYTVTGTAELNLTATKQLTGRDMTAGEFEFHVYEGGKQVAIGKNDANGVVTFDTITYTVDDIGQHTYVIHEEPGTAGGVNYDPATYTVVVYVTDDGEGNLTVVEMTVPQMTFSNTYTVSSTTLTLTGTKVLTGRAMTAGEFRFTVTDTDGKQVAVGTNTAAGVINFTALSFTQPGTYTYYIKETQGDKGGMTYDQDTVTVTVTVVDNGDGTLRATYTTDAGAIKFENTYETTDAQLVLTGNKTLTGRELTEGQFTFHVYEGSKLVSTGKNDAFGKITFDAIKYTMSDIGTHTYRVNEVIENAAGYGYDHTVYTVVVEVTDNGDGTLSVTKTRDPALRFANTYTVTLIDVTLLGTKQLTGRDMEAGEFRFELCDSMGNVLQSVPNNENGSFGFLVEDLAAGTYTYKIREQIPVNGLAGVTYDNTVYEVVVQVTDNGDGTLSHTISVTGDQMVLFTNSYRPAITEKVTVSGTKTLTGRTQAMKPGEFTFSVYNDQKVKVGSAANDAQGNILVDLGSFSGAGTYTFTVTEDIPNEKHGITYDPAEYRITVTVTDDTKQGKLVAETVVTQNGQAVNGLDFTNTYSTEPIDVELSGSKVLTGRTLKDGEFTFKLTDKSGKEVTTTNASDGSFSFKLEDLSAGVYTYTVEEVKGNLGGISYDTGKITATVTVTDDNKGNLTAKTVYTLQNQATDLIFRNSYTVTGEKSLSLNGQKNLEGRTLKDGEFTFKITENGQTVATGKNDVNGKIAFSAITYTPADIGQHFYVVSEDNDGAGGVSYDDTVYTVLVTVADDGKGGITVSYTVDGATDKQIVFNNGYSFAGSEELTIAGAKLLKGDRVLAAGDFSFVLKLDGKEIQTVKNNADGSFAFDKLTFTQADVGSHVYTVSEVNTGKAGYTYDTTVYTYTVTVADNGEGGITVTKKLTAGTQAAEGIAFTNTYTITGNAETEISGTKKLTGDKKLAEGEFSFQLKDSTGAVVETVKNDADGNIKFSKLTYTKADIGTHTYTVSEVNEGKAGYTYDATVYTVTVEVKDNGAGGLTVTKTANPTIVFENDYTITGSGEITITGTKVLTGKALEAGDFTFQLMGQNGLVDTATNAADGSFSFKTLTYTKADIGTHTYTVSETKGSKGGITYDNTVYTVTVTVADNGAGGLTVTASGAQNIQFNNTYAITKDLTVAFVAQKQLIGKTMVNGEFSFVIMEGDKLVAEGTNDANGQVKFSEIVYTAADIGKHTYTVYEIAGDVEGMTYDSTVYTVIVDVFDDGNGGLDANISYVNDQYPSFTNTFVPKDLNVKLDVNKTLVNNGTGAMTPEGFKFVLTDAEGNVAAEAISDAVGMAEFALTYKLEHVGKYTYTLTEVNTGATGVTYDAAVYTVTVEVAQGADGQLVSQVTITDAAGSAVEQVTFVNSYTPPVTPPTGDTSAPQVFMTICHVSGVAMVLMLAVLVIDTRKKKLLSEEQEAE